MKTLCVLADRFTEAELRRLGALLAGRELSLLAFSRAGTSRDSLRRLYGASIRSEADTSRLMDEAVPRARERFTRFCAEWPTRPLIGGKGFKELFVREGLSLWWLCELSQKNTEARPTFGYLCELEALRSALASGGYSEVVLLVKNPDLIQVFRGLCRTMGARTVTRRWYQQRGAGGLVALLIGRVKWYVHDAASSIAARRLPRRPQGGGRPAAEETAGAGTIAFYTWYPAQWAQWRGALRDRYYVHLPEVLGERGGWTPVYACSVPSSGPRDLLRNWRRIAKEEDGTEAGTRDFLERYTTPWRVTQLYSAVGPALRYLWLEWFTPSFKASFRYEDVNIFPIARHDVRGSMIRDLPRDLLLAERVRQFVRAARPDWLVTILELYVTGRAITWGVRRAGIGTQVIGFQHSPVNPNQLFYRYRPEELGADHHDGAALARLTMPIPDLFVLHGLDAKRMLEASGVPSARLRLCGSPRFDDLPGYREERLARRDALRARLGAPSGMRLVLVAGVVWPGATEDLLRLCGEAAAGRQDVMLIVKAHPLCRVSERRIAALVGARGSVRWMCSEEPLNLLQAAAEAMVTGNSTSDVEAIAIGCPVIRVRLGDVDSSPASEVPGTALTVRTAGELAEALRRVFTGEFKAEGWPGLVEDVFYRLDGQATQRFLEVLEESTAPVEPDGHTHGTCSRAPRGANIPAGSRDSSASPDPEAVSGGPQRGVEAACPR